VRVAAAPVSNPLEHPTDRSDLRVTAPPVSQPLEHTPSGADSHVLRREVLIRLGGRERLQVRREGISENIAPLERWWGSIGR
jgi:hypothetical protein